MRAVIIGAGNAGYHLAAKLSEMKHDVVVIDEDANALAEINTQFDVLTLRGNGASPSVLQQAEIQKADLLVAVTNHDETNLLACMFAKAAGVPHRIARVNNMDFLSRYTWLKPEDLGADLVVCHKEECARDMFNILTLPEATELVSLFGGRMKILGFQVPANSPLLKSQIRELQEGTLIQSFRFIAVKRHNDLIIPRGNTQILADDDVYVILPPELVDEFIAWSHPERATIDKVVIAGGGVFGLRLAQLLESTPLQLTVIERDKERAHYCSAQLRRALVLDGDALDVETMQNAGITTNTAFAAVTDDDEDNIIACLLGRKMGAAFTLAQVNKWEYVPIIDNLELVDRIISPHLSMTNAIMRFEWGHNVKSARLFQNVPVELLEIEVPAGHRWVDLEIQQIRMPRDVMIAAIARGDEVLIPTGNLKVLTGDRLVIVCLPRSLKKLRGFF